RAWAGLADAVAVAVAVGLGVIEGVEVDVAVGVGEGVIVAVAVAVGVGGEVGPDCAQYVPPGANWPFEPATPQRSLWLPGHHRVAESCDRCVGSVGGGPTICCGIVSAASVQVAVTATSGSTPDDHLAPGPHRGECFTSRRCVDRTGSRPAVHAWVVSAASSQI